MECRYASHFSMMSSILRASSGASITASALRQRAATTRSSGKRVSSLASVRRQASRTRWASRFVRWGGREGFPRLLAQRAADLLLAQVQLLADETPQFLVGPGELLEQGLHGDERVLRRTEQARGQLADRPGLVTQRLRDPARHLLGGSVHVSQR